MSANFDPTKPAYQKTEYSQEQIVDLIQCESDPFYFIKNHIKIQTDKGIEPLELYPFQFDMVDAFHNHKDSVVLTARQCGKTTTAAAYLLHFAMFNDDKTILIVSNVFRAALEVMHRVRSMYELCPDHVRAGVKTFNKTSIEFDNGSRIVSQATTSNTGRGMTIHLLYVDEMAFCPPNIIEDLWTSVSPTLAASKGKSIITSTPNSDVDMFARIWQGANDLTDEYGNPDPACQNGEGKNGYYAYSATWDKNPSRSKEWAIKEEAKIGKQKFLQEHCCHFVGSDETLINSMYLSSLKYKTEPEFYTGTVRWYVEPQPNRTYLIALDPSLGTGGDYSAIQVFMLPEMEQVAEWQNNTTPAKGQIRTLMQILHTIDGDLREHPDQHGDPEIYWTVENNTIGEAVLQIIEDTGEDRFPGQMINEKKKKGSSRRFRKGLNTDNRKKLSSCAKLKSLIESKRMTIHSRNLVTELKNFIARGASYAAKPGTHDDLVSATLLVTRMLETVIEWSGGGDALKERIGDDELFGDEDGLFAQDEDSAPMPTVV